MAYGEALKVLPALRPSGLKLKLLRISRRLSGVRLTVVP